jgi:hypothetical protein
VAGDRAAQAAGQLRFGRSGRAGDEFVFGRTGRMIQATSEQLDAWRRRDLSSTAYQSLYLDGAYFSVRRGLGYAQ